MTETKKPEKPTADARSRQTSKTGRSARAATRRSAKTGRSPLQPATADLCDAYPDRVRVLHSRLHDYGGREVFHGPVATVCCFEDNTVVRASLEQPGDGRILVVDGGGSTRCALLGDVLARLAVENGWIGAVIWGCVRDTAALASIPFGIRALGTCPRRSVKRDQGERDVPLYFAGTRILPGEHLYADRDGILLTAHELSPAR